MKVARDWLGRYRWRTSATVAAAAIVLVVFVLTVLHLAGADTEEALRDPLATARERTDVPVETGWLSHAGVLGWWTTAVICLTAAWVLRGRSALAAQLAVTGALSAGLGIDDLYLVHELLWPLVTGRTEKSMLLGWVLLVGLWAWRYRTALGQQRLLPILGLAGGLFAVSMGLDLVIDLNVVEDGAKLVAILLWATFHGGIAIGALRAALEDRAGVRYD